MSGCDDPRFAAFTKRTAHVDHPKFLTLKTMQKVIAGLENWHETSQAKARANIHQKEH